MVVIDIQRMRYINLLDKISRVKTTKCFIYNNTIIFAVPRRFMGQAIGSAAENIRKLQERLGKKVRIVEEPEGLGDAGKFTESIVAPAKFKSIELREGVFVLTAGIASKAVLIGRNKKRLEELGQILKDNFGFGLKII